MSGGTQGSPKHKLTPNLKKILEAVLFLLNQAENRGECLTQYDIVKSIFLADRSHLNRYGRPVTFDNYYAMRNGPVPTTVYDLLKGSENILAKFDIDEPLWQTEDAPQISPKAKIYTHPIRMPREDTLSPSDEEALKDALGTVNSLTFPQLRKLTHDDPAYIDAWDENGNARAYLISYGKLFDNDNFDQAEHLSFSSKHI